MAFLLLGRSDLLIRCRGAWGAEIGVGESLNWERAATVPARGGNMLNLATVVGQLKKERERARREVAGLDTALKVLGGLVSPNRRSTGAPTGTKKRSPMSAAARKRIAAAQRARWAKWKSARRNK